MNSLVIGLHLFYKEGIISKMLLTSEDVKLTRKLEFKWTE
ncbi:hypothetical protein ABH901_000070 [Mammaliicoccus lentus]